jgi:hypothetical protein
MHTIAFPLIYLMVAVNPAPGQWEQFRSFVFPDQESCLVNRQAWGDAVLGDASKYFCLAYKDTRYMMEILQKGHWLPLCGRGLPYASGHGVDNVSYSSKEACLEARQERFDSYEIHSAHPPYRCVPYSSSYVDKDDPPSWTLQFRLLPHEPPSRHRWFYTRADCVSMGRYWVGRNSRSYLRVHSLLRNASCSQCRFGADGSSLLS